MAIQAFNPFATPWNTDQEFESFQETVEKTRRRRHSNLKLDQPKFQFEGALRAYQDHLEQDILTKLKLDEETLTGGQKNQIKEAVNAFVQTCVPNKAFESARAYNETIKTDIDQDILPGSLTVVSHAERGAIINEINEVDAPAGIRLLSNALQSIENRLIINEKDFLNIVTQNKEKVLKEQLSTCLARIHQETEAERNGEKISVVATAHPKVLERLIKDNAVDKTIDLLTDFFKRLTTEPEFKTSQECANIINSLNNNQLLYTSSGLPITLQQTADGAINFQISLPGLLQGRFSYYLSGKDKVLQDMTQLAVMVRDTGSDSIEFKLDGGSNEQLNLSNARKAFQGALDTQFDPSKITIKIGGKTYTKDDLETEKVQIQGHSEPASIPRPFIYHRETSTPSAQEIFNGSKRIKDRLNNITGTKRTYLQTAADVERQLQEAQEERARRNAPVSAPEPETASRTTPGPGPTDT